MNGNSWKKKVIEVIGETISEEMRQECDYAALAALYHVGEKLIDRIKSL